MDKKFFVPFGLLMLFIGVMLILNSVSGITGLVVLENVSTFSGSAVGIVLLVLGIFSLRFGSSRS